MGCVSCGWQVYCVLKDSNESYFWVWHRVASCSQRRWPGRRSFQALDTVNAITRLLRRLYLSFFCFWSCFSFHSPSKFALFCFFNQRGHTSLSFVFQLFLIPFCLKCTKTRPPLFTQKPAPFISYLLSSVYMSCWMLRLLQWYSTCPCCEMIHLQVCLSASQASSHSFSPPLPQMSKSASFTQASKTLPFLTYDFTSQGGVCLSLWIPTKQALMASLCITWVNYTPLRKNMHAL